MNRRRFLATASVATAGFALPTPFSLPNAENNSSTEPVLRLAGLSVQKLRNDLHQELFQNYLPLWDKHGVDHEFGGLMCSMDYDGTLANTDKLTWFQGRGLWVYSYLYNHFGNDPRHLDIARKTKDFLLTYAQQSDGWWAEKLSRDGKVLVPFGGDIEGIYFIAEGLQEYSVAANDEKAHLMAAAILKKLFRYFNRPEFRYSGPDFPNLKPDGPCVRPQGTWMLNLNISTQMLQKWQDAEISEIAEHSTDAIINRHYNPEIRLNTEMLYYDFSRPPEERQKSRLGHCIEVLWMAMDEADRRGDKVLWNTCAERIQHHIDVAWDRVYGGIAQWVNVDQGAYVWPPETPVGTNFAFKFVGEYNYMKTLWGINEVLVATLKVFERTKADWAAEYFGMAYNVLNEKFRLKSRGLPGYVLFTDRQFTFEPHASRQDNYHPVRQLMLNLRTLDSILQPAKV